MKSHTCKAILALALFAGVLPLSAQMIAEITGPVETEFGTYIPQPSQILPAAEPYTVAPDLSNVVNAGDFSFDVAERGLLARNHFFVTPKRSGPNSGYKEMYDLYNEAREQNIPIFVTTDALLHSFHLVLTICSWRSRRPVFTATSTGCSADSSRSSSTNSIPL